MQMARGLRKTKQRRLTGIESLRNKATGTVNMILRIAIIRAEA